MFVFYCLLLRDSITAGTLKGFLSNYDFSTCRRLLRHRSDSSGLVEKVRGLMLRSIAVCLAHGAGVPH